MTKEEYLNSDFVRMAHLNKRVAHLTQENKKLEKKTKQLEAQIRKLKCCGNCDRHDNRECCLYSKKCYTYIYIHQYLRPFFCAPVNLKDIEDYKDFWKPISCTYHIRGEKK